MPALTPAERSLRGKIAVETSWANTKDRSARTANARRALEEKFLREADGDHTRAAHLRKAHFARLALKSAQARRRKAVVAERLAESNQVVNSLPPDPAKATTDSDPPTPESQPQTGGSTAPNTNRKAVIAERLAELDATGGAA